MGGDLGLTAAAPHSPVPELGPMLGRLLRTATEDPVEALLAPVRLALLDDLLTLAARARSAPAPAAARAALSDEAWLGAFRRAAEEAARRCLTEMDRRLTAAAALSLMPSRLVAPHRPDQELHRVVRNRCLGAAIPLERVAPPQQADDWEQGLLRAAMAAEEGWERLREVVAEELARGETGVARVAGWRRSRAGLWVATALVLAGALTLGLSLGGYLPAPGPLGALRDAWWRLPWP